MLGSVKTGAVAVVDEVSVLRVKLQSDVPVSVLLLALELDHAADGNAGPDDAEAVRFVNVAVGIGRLYALLR